MFKSLRIKILLGYSITLILTVVVIVLALMNIVDLGNATDAILQENYRSILAAENMIDAIERQDSGLLLMLLGYVEENKAMFQTHESNFLQWFGRARDNVTIRGEQEIIDSIDSLYMDYLGKTSELRLHIAREDSTAPLLYHESVLPSFMSVRNMCASLREINQNTMYNASLIAGEVAERAMWSMVVIGAIVIIVGVGFSLFLSKLLVRPLRQMLEATKEIASGSYNINIRTKSRDEVGKLAEGFNTMARELKLYSEMNIEQILAEKHKSEAVLRNIDDGVILIDADSTVTAINPSAAEALSVGIDQVGGTHALEIIKNDRLYEMIKRTIETGEAPAIGREERIISLGGEEKGKTYQFNITPIKTKRNALIGVVLQLRDITHFRELDRLKSEFVMTASHELRTPLTSMEMSISLLKEGTESKLSDKEKELLNAADEDVHRLKSLVNDLLDLSRIESGKIEMEFDRVDPAMLLEKAEAALTVSAEERKVELRRTAREDLPPVKADPNKITWVLTNLVSNALRYTGEDGVIELKAVAAGPQVQISVSDNGAGIPYEQQSRIFDKFAQVKGDARAGGSGLGLAICREIVRAHGGTIWVDSVPGEGSTFSFTLPVYREKSKEKA
ncbi:MAG: ATP-binding protein [Candidatus Aegiribacteria sp.]